MATVSTTYYRTTWGGSFDGTDSELTALLGRAEDVIDSSIYLSGVTVAEITDSRQNAVYKAVCAQTDYIDACGGTGTMNDSGAESMSLGRFSYSGGGGSGGSCNLCEQARSYLLSTGLLYRGC